MGVVMPLFEVAHLCRWFSYCIFPHQYFRMSHKQPNPCPFHGRLTQLRVCTQDVKVYPVILNCIKWELLRHCLNWKICVDAFHIASSITDISDVSTEPMPLFSLSSLPLPEPTSITLATFFTKISDLVMVYVPSLAVFIGYKMKLQCQIG